MCFLLLVSPFVVYVSYHSYVLLLIFLNVIFRVFWDAGCIALDLDPDLHPRGHGKKVVPSCFSYVVARFCKFRIGFPDMLKLVRLASLEKL